MELKELEFKGRDCFRAHRESQDLVIPGEVDSWDALAVILNRILREKLANAPEVEAFISHHKLELWAKYQNLNGHKRARLVCIEEVGK